VIVLREAGRLATHAEHAEFEVGAHAVPPLTEDDALVVPLGVTQRDVEVLVDSLRVDKQPEQVRHVAHLHHTERRVEQANQTRVVVRRCRVCSREVGSKVGVQLRRVQRCVLGAATGELGKDGRRCVPLGERLERRRKAMAERRKWRAQIWRQRTGGHGAAVQMLVASAYELGLVLQERDRDGLEAQILDVRQPLLEAQVEEVRLVFVLLHLQLATVGAQVWS